MCEMENMALFYINTYINMGKGIESTEQSHNFSFISSFLLTLWIKFYNFLLQGIKVVHVYKKHLFQ